MDNQKKEERKPEDSKVPETTKKNPVPAGGRTLTPEDEEALVKRLRDLGYIE